MPFVFSFCPYLKSPWKNVALRYNVACETRRNWFIWEETENDSEIALMNGNATWPLMIIFLREYFFQKGRSHLWDSHRHCLAKGEIVSRNPSAKHTSSAAPKAATSASLKNTSSTSSAMVPMCTLGKWIKAHSRFSHAKVGIMIH